MKRRVIKLVYGLSIVTMVLSLFGGSVEAATNVQKDSNCEYHGTGVLYDEEYELNPNVQIYRDSHLTNNAGNMARRPSNGVYLFSVSDFWSDKVTKVYENGYSKPKVFIGYLSSTWAKRSSYSDNVSTTVTWSKSGNISLEIADAVKGQFGLSNSMAIGVGISSQIPADSNKYSKLALYVDYHDYYLKCNVVNFAETKVYETYYGDVLFPTEDYYLDVVYK